MMDDLERELRLTLARREPSADFAGRVVARLERREDSAAGVVTLPVRGARRGRWQPLVAGAIAAGLAAVGFGVHQYQEYQRGVEAKRQLMVALEITAEKLHVAQDKVNQRNQRP